MNAANLRKRLIASLEEQGFRLENGNVLPPEDPTKQDLRDLHESAVAAKRKKAAKRLARHEPALLSRIARGTEIDPHRMRPRLVEVTRKSQDERLFRYASLHWSIPVSSGYGRRLRYLVVDDHTDKLIGLIGLGDPVFSLAPRDEWIGWNWEQRRERLRHVLDAFVLGAVPPYSFLLSGKLVAMLVASQTVRERFEEKYRGEESLIRQREDDGQVALITTVSALGRSSIYNRLRLKGRTLYRRTGFTKGSGEFHFSNGLYSDIREYAEEHVEPTAKHDDWGTGFRNRREIVRKTLSDLGVSDRWIYHGVEREVFAVPLAANSRAFLCGEDCELNWYDDSTEEITGHFKERWMLPRLDRLKLCKAWNREDWLLWTDPSEVDLWPSDETNGA